MARRRACRTADIRPPARARRRLDVADQLIDRADRGRQPAKIQRHAENLMPDGRFRSGSLLVLEGAELWLAFEGAPGDVEDLVLEHLGLLRRVEPPDLLLQ